MPNQLDSRYGKRLFDVTLALALAVPAIVLCAPMAILIWLDDRANPLFIQRRLGRDGRVFQLVKLRTMRTGTGDRPSHEALANSITPLGQWLRRTKVDELPQLWNVLRGEMSFVGPRPGLPSQIELAQSRKRYGVHRLLPGITGVSQVRGLDMSTPELLAEIDATYIGTWSLRRDLALLVQTARGGGQGDAAARRIDR
ncbi:sugar transferase [Sphingomonas sp. 7/4-4]|uniref:sugar transferase n=1 Tax=Sphingomonas sp. 7/4-4 TaxID=3018446 RepID=UPI0022F405CB|nr:sugar transferase [Sphingomonas sp. 7/4-4]WBY07947.1 sugar transferase [Sphingomonas sp. 7/4-4]